MKPHLKIKPDETIQQFKERVAATVYNDAFKTNYVGVDPGNDGVTLVAMAHPNGGPLSDVEINEASLVEVCSGCHLQIAPKDTADSNVNWLKFCGCLNEASLERMIEEIAKITELRVAGLTPTPAYAKQREYMMFTSKRLHDFVAPGIACAHCFASYEFVQDGYAHSCESFEYLAKRIRPEFSYGEFAEALDGYMAEHAMRGTKSSPSHRRRVCQELIEADRRKYAADRASPQIEATRRFRQAIIAGLDELLHEMRNDGLVVDLPVGDRAFFEMEHADGQVSRGVYTTFMNGMIKPSAAPAYCCDEQLSEKPSSVLIEGSARAIVAFVRKELQQPHKPGNVLYLGWRMLPDVTFDADTGRWNTRARLCALIAPRVPYVPSDQFNPGGPFRLCDPDIDTTALRKRQDERVEKITRERNDLWRETYGAEFPEMARRDSANAVQEMLRIGNKRVQEVADRIYRTPGSVVLTGEAAEHAKLVIAEAQFNHQRVAKRVGPSIAQACKAMAVMAVDGGMRGKATRDISRALTLPLPSDYDLHERVIAPFDARIVT